MEFHNGDFYHLVGCLLAFYSSGIEMKLYFDVTLQFWQIIFQMLFSICFLDAVFWVLYQKVILNLRM
eukprot:UN07144